MVLDWKSVTVGAVGGAALSIALMMLSRESYSSLHPKVKKALDREQDMDHPLKQFTDDVNDSFYRVEGVTPEAAEKWKDEDGGFKGDDNQNDSPTVDEMLEIVKKYKGTLIGYVIPKKSKREDYRVSFDGFVLPVGRTTAKRVAHEVPYPDEFSETEKGWRFWWD